MVFNETDPAMAMPSLPVAPEPPPLAATAQPPLSVSKVNLPAVMVVFLTNASVVYVMVLSANDPAIPADFLPGSEMEMATAPAIDTNLESF